MASTNMEGHSPAVGAEYVRKDVFDARMDRMEMLMEKTLTEIKADNEKLRSEMNTAISDLRSEMKVLDSRIDGLNMRVDALQTTVYWGFALMGLILAFAVLVPSLLDFFKGLRKPSLTAEDVERMISAALRREATR